MFSPWLMGKMVSSQNVAEAALSYVKWRLPGLFFAYITAMFRAFYVGTTQTKTLTLNSITMVLSNVVFNWILVFGKFGVPALGIAGAAIGSTLAELVSLIFFIVYTATRTDCAKYGLDRFGGFSFRKLGNILTISVWTMVQNAVSISTWFIFFCSLNISGKMPLAVSNIIRNVSGLIWMVLMAFSSTCSSLVSNIIGNGHPEAVKGLVIRILKFSYGAVAVIAGAHSPVPSCCDKDIHQHPGHNRSLRAVALGALQRVYPHGPGKHLLPGRVWDRQHEDGVPARAHRHSRSTWPTATS